MPCLLLELPIRRQGDPAFCCSVRTGGRHLPGTGTYSRGRSWWPPCWPQYQEKHSRLSQAQHMCSRTWPGGQRWRCCQWQFKKWPITCPQQCFTEVCRITGGNSDQVIQCVPFCPRQPLWIIQNRVISLWPCGRRDQKSFTLDYLMLLWLASLLEMSGLVSVSLPKSASMSGVADIFWPPGHMS